MPKTHAHESKRLDQEAQVAHWSIGAITGAGGQSIFNEGRLSWPGVLKKDPRVHEGPGHTRDSRRPAVGSLNALALGGASATQASGSKSKRLVVAADDGSCDQLAGVCEIIFAENM